MTYDNELTLIKEAFTIDEIGNQIPGEKRTEVLCNVKSVGRNEFYNAAATGLNPEIIFEIHKYEYCGERRVEFEENLYNVIRTYSSSFEEVELVCGRWFK